MGNDRPKRKMLGVTFSAKLEAAELKLRCATNGLWLCTLIPCAVLSNLIYWNHYSQLYKIISIIAIGLFLNSTCDILHKHIDCLHTVPSILGVRICSTVMVSSSLITFTDTGIYFALCLAVMTVSSYSPFLKLLIEHCPGCFTYGEAILVTQSFILYLASFVTNVKLLFKSSVEDCQTISTLVVQAGFFAVLVTVAVSYLLAERVRKFHVFLGVLVSSFVLFVVLLPAVVIETNALTWIWQLISNATTLICFWVVCCLLAVLWLLYSVHANKSTRASSAGRKSFHFLMFFVFMAGLVQNSCLMFVSSGVAFAVLVVAETIRKLEMEGVSSPLQLCFETFEDEKDEGHLALTPLYLMVGCAAPLWIYPFTFSQSIPLPVLSGLLTVAVGDAAASVCGTYFGVRRWPGSVKTIEGSVCCFLSQVVVLLTLHSLEMVQITYIWWSCFVMLVCSLVEAYTDQVDNLILPFIAYILLNVLHEPPSSIF